MFETRSPASEEELADHLAAASAAGRTFAVRGRRTHAMIGRVAHADAILDTTALTGPIDYDPTELVLTAPCGAPLTTIERMLAAHDQMLAFEPPVLDWLASGASDDGTLGGLVATNLSGSRRIAAGALRDHVLGVRVVTGNGLAIKSGGRVVKNVTGYDISKLMCGAFGTLGVLSEVTLRVVPRPRDSLTLFMPTPNAAAAATLMAIVLGGAHATSGAAYLPAALAGAVSVATEWAIGQGVVAVRLEGSSETLGVRRDSLIEAIGSAKITGMIGHDDSCRFWHSVSAGRILREATPTYLWRLSIPPAMAAPFIDRFDTMPDWRYFLDWGGGLVWLGHVADGEPDAESARKLDGLVRRSLAEIGGHGLLLRAPEGVRDGLAAFQPLSRGELALSQRIKAAFDPKGILNPRFMYAAF